MNTAQSSTVSVSPPSSHTTWTRHTVARSQSLFPVVRTRHIGTRTDMHQDRQIDTRYSCGKHTKTARYSVSSPPPAFHSISSLLPALLSISSPLPALLSISSCLPALLSTSTRRASLVHSSTINSRAGPGGDNLTTGRAYIEIKCQLSAPCSH